MDIQYKMVSPKTIYKQSGTVSTCAFIHVCIHMLAYVAITTKERDVINLRVKGKHGESWREGIWEDLEGGKGRERVIGDVIIF